MNKRALRFGLLYSLLVIAFKLIILLGGYTLSRFGFNYSHIISVFFILPFFIITAKQVRDKERGGIISGKDVVRLCLTVLMAGMILTSLYNYVEFEWTFKDIAIQYYNSNEYLEMLKTQQAKNPGKIKIEDFPKIIKEQVSSLSAFRATTGKLFPLLFIGLSGAFITAVFIKRSPK
jgi:hypothetical protein